VIAAVTLAAHCNAAQRVAVIRLFQLPAWELETTILLPVWRLLLHIVLLCSAYFQWPSWELGSLILSMAWLLMLHVVVCSRLSVCNALSVVWPCREPWALHCESIGVHVAASAAPSTGDVDEMYPLQD
jgi:hypothetical protein